MLKTFIQSFALFWRTTPFHSFPDHNSYIQSSIFRLSKIKLTELIAQFSHSPFVQHLNDFLDGAGDQGFIFVSMGTSVNPKTMAPALLKTIVSAFRQLPYRILWKFDNDLGQVELPSNVRVEQWLPQQDVLGINNCTRLQFN